MVEVGKAMGHTSTKLVQVYKVWTRLITGLSNSKQPHQTKDIKARVSFPLVVSIMSVASAPKSPEGSFS